MKSMILSLYIIVCYLLVLEGYGDHALLLWPLFVLLFFWDTQKSIGLAFVVGFLLDLYSPIFGIFSFLFPATLFFGNILIHSLLSHRSFSSFHSVSAILICLFTASEYIFFMIASSIHMDTSLTLPPFHFYIALRLLTIIAQTIFLSFAYIIAQRMEKRFGYSIDTVRRV